MSDGRPTNPKHAETAPDDAPELHARATAVFTRLLALPVAERAAALEDECGDDDALRAEVASLLSHHDDQDSQVDDPATATLARAVFAQARPVVDREERLPRERLGRYRLLRRLGRGGMGEVFEAEQEHPRRRVALKVMRPGLMSAELLKRFEREATVLGQLDHPAIASIYEAGEAEDEHGERLPFFAMELVHGETLLRHADRLPLRKRLQLLAETCDGIHHAHVRGFVHRDLKPANILVTREGRPKILDFGVARASGSDVALPTLHTEVGQVVGTLSYMSPEQARGDATRVDIRADVYALGVIAFQLLAHRLPVDVGSVELPEAIRRIQEDEPARLESLDRRLGGDLDTIVAHALEKEPERRYQSAAALADDLRRFLRHEPITARPASALYQLKKFSRRHRTLVAVAAGVFVTLALATIVLIRAWRTEVGLRELADAKTAEAEQREAEARWQSYRTSVTGAAGALSTARPLVARRHLNAAPSESRGWEWHHLDGRLDDALLVQDFEGEPLSLTVSGDDERLRLVRRTTDDGPIAVDHLDAITGRLVLRERLDSDEVPMSSRARVPNPSGTLVQVHSIHLRVVDDETGRPHCLLPNALGEATPGVAWVDDRILYTGGGNRTLSRWDVEACELVGATPVDQRITALASTGSDWIAVAGSGSVAILDQAEHAVHRRLHALAGRVRELAWDSDGTRLHAVTDDSRLATWDVDSKTDPRRLAGHESYVYDAVFIPGTATLASASWDGTVRFWDSTSGAPLGVLELASRFSDSSLGVRVLASPEGRWLAVELHGSSRQRTVVLDARTGQVQQVLERRGYSLGFLDERRFLDAEGIVWNLVTGESRALFTPAQRGVTSPDGTRAFLVEEPSIRAWDLESGRAGPTRVVTGSDHDDRIFELACSPDGTLLAATGERLRLLSAETLEELAVHSLDAFHCFCVAFSPDGQRLFAGLSDGTLLVLDVASRQEVLRLQEHSNYIYGLDVSSDGTRVVTASGDGTLRLWDSQSLGEVARHRLATTRLRTKLTPEIEALFRSRGEAAAVLEALEGELAFTPDELLVARQLVLSRSLERIASHASDGSP
ncbi:MAG: protein kinase [Acidobacteriota bacterium]